MAYRRYNRNYRRSGGYGYNGRRYYRPRAYNRTVVVAPRRRYYRRRTSSSKKGSFSFGPKGFRVHVSPAAVLGFVAGLTNLDRQVPPQALLVASSLPVSGSIGRAMKDGAGGAILGEVVSQKTGKGINFPATTKTASVTTFYA